MGKAHELARALSCLDAVLTVRLEQRRATEVHHADPGRRIQALCARTTELSGDDPLPSAADYVGGGPLAKVADLAGLDEAEVLVLVAAVAPYVDERYAVLLGALTDRPGVAGPTGESLRNLCGRTVAGQARAVRALSADGALQRCRLIEVERHSDGPLAGPVRVPHDALTALLGVPPERPVFSPEFPASPLTTVHDLADLVAPRAVLRRVADVLDRIAQRDQVVGEWGFGARHDNVEGLTVLFHGSPGTGKTMTAAMIAKAAGLAAFRVDLANIVSKYIGETAKNLERVFRHAERERCLLFFDEADAVFGQRGEVSDARDRYANQEVSYLLQRIETFPGIVVLATNLLANIDEAFLRRIDVQIEFPTPDARHRRRMWERVMPPELPQRDIDYGDVAQRFELTGAQIRDAAVEAAYQAAANGGVVVPEHLDAAIRMQFQKSGLMVPG
jgi:adenylate kinase family enzyme